MGVVVYPGGGELPPRTRRIPKPRCSNNTVHGTTSAYAENTFWPLFHSLLCRNYLRVRGEYPSTGYPPVLTLELPPRTRRIRGFPAVHGEVDGTTSAYAENTSVASSKPWVKRNYLRVRGEYPTQMRYRIS